MVKLNKKADMTIWIIVTAALALMALVVLATILAGRTRIFSENLQSCAAKQGQCKEKCELNEALVTNTNCPEGADPKYKKCCVQVFVS